MLAVQYLENGTYIAGISPEQARARLREAFARLPIDCVILGWNLPSKFVGACIQESIRAGAKTYLWHPLLTGDSLYPARPEWQTIGVNGERVPGFKDLPDFTFICLNQPAAFEATMTRLRQAIRGGDYQGVFLDRIRYPSPGADPIRHLACFCPDCQRLAVAEGLDLPVVQKKLQTLLVKPELGRLPAFLRVLLDSTAEVSSDPVFELLHLFLDFRARSVTRIVQAAAEIARAEGLSVGLDCFTPALAYMVGQDLAALDAHCDWIKVMTYAHAYGPAGLPFELSALAGWLKGFPTIDEGSALDWLAQAAHLPLPIDMITLREYGLSPEALAIEIRRARAARMQTLLAGVELVDLEGVTHLNSDQIAVDLRAIREADPDGLVLSWDLWWIPLERLEIVRRSWLL